jgi:hypothetical protein
MKTLLYENQLFGKKPIGITNGRYEIREATNSEVDKMVVKYHYSHKATQNRFRSFFVNGDKGFLQLGYGIRPHIKHTICRDINTNNYCEFDRMWLSDELPKFAESQVISLLLSYLKQVYKNIEFVITYADGSVGNYGTIYKATNAFYLGKINVDFYILKSGERVHPVSMWHRHKSRAWALMQSLYPGIKHITDEYQYRFLYILNKKERRKFVRNEAEKFRTARDFVGGGRCPNENLPRLR